MEGGLARSIRHASNDYYNKIKSTAAHKVAKKTTNGRRWQGSSRLSAPKRSLRIEPSLSPLSSTTRRPLKSPILTFPSYNQRIKIYSLDMPDLSDDILHIPEDTPDFLITPPTSSHYHGTRQSSSDFGSSDFSSAHLSIGTITPMSITPRSSFIGRPRTGSFPFDFDTLSDMSTAGPDEEKEDFKQLDRFEPFEKIEPLEHLGFRDIFPTFAPAFEDVETKSMSSDLSDMALAQDEVKAQPSLVFLRLPKFVNQVKTRAHRTLSYVSIDSDDSDFDTSIPPLIDPTMPLLEVLSPRSNSDDADDQKSDDLQEYDTLYAPTLTLRPQSPDISEIPEPSLGSELGNLPELADLVEPDDLPNIDDTPDDLFDISDGMDDLPEIDDIDDGYESETEELSGQPELEPILPPLEVKPFYCSCGEVVMGRNRDGSRQCLQCYRIYYQRQR